jgi:anti-anti-sigma factor
MILVLTRWQNEEAATRAARAFGWRRREVPGGAAAPAPHGTGTEAARAPAAPGPARGPRQDEVVPLATLFDLEFARSVTAATLLRVAVGARPPGAAAAARDRELALRAMAEPGSQRVAGARSLRHHLTTCRIDFDLEDALWHFLESPLRREWTSLARGLQQQEIWALNLPRYRRAAGAPPRSRTRSQAATRKRASTSTDSLSLELQVESPRSAVIRFSGHLGDAGLARLEAMAAALVRDGCRTLTLDIRALDAPDAAAMRSLLRIVRQVKSLGGEVRLVEQDDRFRRAVRIVNLERSLAT